MIELPAQKPLRVVVYSAEPQSLRPLIASNPQVDAVFEPPAKYDAQAKADIVVLDRFAPPARPQRRFDLDRAAGRGLADSGARTQDAE